MEEEIIISGRMIPHVDPHLELWHWPISLYLFLGGLSAGILFFAALFTVLGKENDFKHTVICGPPGTGKTEIAKIIGKMYSKLGILKNNVFKKQITSCKIIPINILYYGEWIII